MIDSRLMPNQPFCQFIYFSPEECRFIILQEQRFKHLILKVDTFCDIDKIKTFEIISYNYSFATLLVGVFIKKD